MLLSLAGSRQTSVLTGACTLLVVLAGCGGGAETTVAPPSPSLTVVTDLPVPVAMADTLTLALADDLTDMAGLEGEVLIGTRAGVVRLEQGAAVPVEVLADASEPTETGAVTAFGDREGSLLVLAANGIFHTWSGYLLRSPLTDALAGLELRGLCAIGTGEDEVVWAAATEGLYRVTATALQAISIPDSDGSPIALAALEDVVLVAYADALFELYPEHWGYVAAPDIGAVKAIHTWEDRAVLSTDRGIAVRDPAGDYTLYTLSGDDAGMAATAVALDLDGEPVASTTGGIVRRRDGTLEWVIEAASGAGTALALDAFGHVWAGSGRSVTGYLVGAPVSFAERVAPIFAVRCNDCHLEGVSAPAHDFTDYEQVMGMVDTILERLQSGQMPPTGPLPEEEYEVVLQWNESGRNP